MRQDLFPCLRNVPTWASCTDGRLYIWDPAKPGLFDLLRGCFNPCYQPAIPGRWMARPDCSCIVLSYCESPGWSRQRSSCVWIPVFVTVSYVILLLAPGIGNFNKTLSTHDLRCHSLGENPWVVPAFDRTHGPEWREMVRLSLISRQKCHKSISRACRVLLSTFLFIIRAGPYRERAISG